MIKALAYAINTFINVYKEFQCHNYYYYYYYFAICILTNDDKT